MTKIIREGVSLFIKYKFMVRITDLQDFTNISQYSYQKFKKSQCSRICILRKYTQEYIIGDGSKFSKIYKNQSTLLYSGKEKKKGTMRFRVLRRWKWLMDQNGI